MSENVPVPSSDGLHCGNCPLLEPYGPPSELSAKCKLTNRDLLYYDYWLATECSDDPKVRKLTEEE